MSATKLKDALDVINWIKKNNGHFNTGLLEIKSSPLGGIGVFAKQDITLNEDMPPPVLLRLHKDSLLSSQKSYISNLLFESKITGALGLIIAFIYELEIKETSPWWDFIKSIKYLDSNNDLILPPSAWTKSEKNLLSGSELDAQGYLSNEELLDNYEKACMFAVRHSLESKGAIPIPNILDLKSPQEEEIVENKFQQFIAISHALASRNFEIDAFHEVALVPGADLFNHTNNPSVRFESMYEVCEACGAFEGACDHVLFSDDDDDEGDGSQDGCFNGEEHDHDNKNDDDMELDKQQEVDEERSDFEGEEVNFEGTLEEFIAHIEQEALEEEENKQADLDEYMELETAKRSGIDINLYSPDIKDIEGKVIHPNSCVDITLTRSVVKGEEIFNTYGELPNFVLLNKYGFVIEHNKYDTVNLGDAFTKLKKFKRGLFRAHFKWWEERGYTQVKRYLRDITVEDQEEDSNDDCCSMEGEEEGKCLNNVSDTCCDDKHHDHQEEGQNESEKDDDKDQDDTWEDNVDLLSTSEPNAITIALLRLLTLHKIQLIKFVGRSEELIPWLFKSSFKLPAMMRRMQRIWRDVLSFRLQDFEYGSLDDIPDDSLEDVRGDRLQFIKSIVGHEFKIVERALNKASIM